MLNTIHTKIIGLGTGLLMAAALLPAQTGKIHGRLTEDGSALPGETIKISGNNGIVRGVVSKMDGTYEFGLLPEGSYTLEIRSGELTYKYAANLALNESKTLPLEMNEAMVYNDEGERVYSVGSAVIQDFIPGERREVFRLDPVTTEIVTGRELGQIAGPRGLQSAIPMLGSDIYQRDAGDPMNIGGARESATAIYVDNVKTRGEFSVAQASISQIGYMNNGLPAEFGDVTGGVITISTFNPGMKPFPGRPLSKAEKQAIRAKRKHGGSEGQLDAPDFHS